MQVEDRFMARCLELARHGAGRTAPNPMVGAVVVHNGEIVGDGYHRQCGEAHAEVNAIASVKDETLLRWSTLYVSLEPCAHHGKTPPCVDLIIRKRIPRVVVGCLDPFPEVSGRGVERLREAGIQVITGVMEKEARELNEAFMTFQTKERPFVTLKWAESADGFIDYKRMENDIKDALDEGKDVTVTTDISYSGDSKRPDTITVTVTADGVKTVYKFDNNLDGSLMDEVPENGKDAVREERAAAIERLVFRPVRVHVHDDAGEIVCQVGIFPAGVHDTPVRDDDRRPVPVLIECQSA